MFKRWRGITEENEPSLSTSKLMGYYASAESLLPTIETAASQVIVDNLVNRVLVGGLDGQAAADEIRLIESNQKTPISRVRALGAQILADANARNAAWPLVQVGGTEITEAWRNQLSPRLEAVSNRLAAAMRQVDPNAAPTPAELIIREAREADNLVPMVMRTLRVPQGWTTGFKIPKDGTPLTYVMFTALGLANIAVLRIFVGMGLLNFAADIKSSSIVNGNGSGSNSCPPPFCSDEPSARELLIKDIFKNNSAWSFFYEVFKGNLSTATVISQPIVIFALVALSAFVLLNTVNYFFGRQRAAPGAVAVIPRLDGFYSFNKISQGIKILLATYVAQVLTALFAYNLIVYRGTDDNPAISRMGANVLLEIGYLVPMFIFAVAGLIYQSIRNCRSGVVDIELGLGAPIFIEKPHANPGQVITDADRYAELIELYDVLHVPDRSRADRNAVLRDPDLFWDGNGGDKSINGRFFSHELADATFRTTFVELRNAICGRNAAAPPGVGDIDPVARPADIDGFPEIIRSGRTASAAIYRDVYILLQKLINRVQERHPRPGLAPLTAPRMLCYR